MTNNLRTHIKSHGDINVWEENLGGRVSQKTVDEAISKQLVNTWKALANCFVTA